MLYSLFALASATHVATFETDPLYTRGPFSGMESVVVDPAVALQTMRPLAPPYAADAEEWSNEAKPGDAALMFTNPTSTWAELSINDVVIGIIGPYATARFEGLRPGIYQLAIKLPTGMVRHFTVRRGPPPRAKVAVAVTVAEKRLELSDKVYFELDSAIIEADSHGLLDAVAAALVEHAEVLRVVVEGHTDNRGDAAYNQKLSEDRAAAVRDYLASKGVTADRLASAGFGESKPVDNAESDAAWEMNRRVEFTIEKRAEAPPPIVGPVKPRPRGKGK